MNIPPEMHFIFNAIFWLFFFNFCLHICCDDNECEWDRNTNITIIERERVENDWKKTVVNSSQKCIYFVLYLREHRIHTKNTMQSLLFLIVFFPLSRFFLLYWNQSPESHNFLLWIPVPIKLNAMPCILKCLLAWYLIVTTKSLFGEVLCVEKKICCFSLECVICLQNHQNIYTNRFSIELFANNVIFLFCRHSGH